MAGIYLHIPFCKQACTYCNFHFTTSLHYKDELLKAIVKEIEMEQHYLENEGVETIYFGGGTPSLLTIDECNFLLDGLKENFSISPKAEITIEANPDDITEEKLIGWKTSGINRLSIGVQSFFEEELRWMNRAHTAQQATGKLQLVRKHFSNITIDLIYGSPLLTDKMWEENVRQAISLNIPHLSCYALTVEEKTPLHKNIILNKSTDVDNEKQAKQFLLLMKWMHDAGYEHYEVSNFARPGFRSRHNSSYWQGKKYLGLGPSAHSYNGRERRWNISNNKVYMNGINENSPKRETEILSITQKSNEYIMIALRTTEGLDLNVIEENWGAEKKHSIQQQLHTLIANGWIKTTDSIVQLTDEGMLRADGIASDLFN